MSEDCDHKESTPAVNMRKRRIETYCIHCNALMGHSEPIPPGGMEAAVYDCQQQRMRKALENE